MDFSFLDKEYASQIVEWAVDLAVHEEGLKNRGEERARRNFVAAKPSTMDIASNVAPDVQTET